jgi:hypothetical protein
MNKFNVEITELAENDLNEIVNYIKYDLLESEVALKTLEKISNKLYRFSRVSSSFSLPINKISPPFTET